MGSKFAVLHLMYVITCQTCEIDFFVCKKSEAYASHANAFESSQSLSASVIIHVAFTNSSEKYVVRCLFVAIMSAFQGHVACRNLPLTGPL